MDNRTPSKLDEEFKNILKLIRPYIIHLKSNDYISACRMWLEKMYTCPINEQQFRNEYLHELCRQLRNGKLEEPFVSPPPSGPLRKLGTQFSSSSWSDMSTVASEIAASGDSQNENEPNTPTNEVVPVIHPINVPNNHVEELKLKNKFLTTRVQEYLVQLNSSRRNSQTEVTVGVLIKEVEYLKMRLQEVISMKKELKDSHSTIVMQWENTTKKLEQRLNEEIQLNIDLKAKVMDLENKIESKAMETVDHMNISNNVQQQLLESHREEMSTLKNKQFEIVRDMEKEYKNALRNNETEWNNKLAEMRAVYEQKMKTMMDENQSNLNFKDQEIVRLESVVDQQCERMQQEVVFIKSKMEQDCSINKESLVEKVTFLQRCILQMEKLLRKYEKHYTKKITVLKKELQMMDKSMQIKLTTQRAQLMARASTERQDEIEVIVSQLEQRYRKLLEDQHSQTSIDRQLLLQTVHELSNKLEQSDLIINK